jgi:hypothetical protein
MFQEHLLHLDLILLVLVLVELFHMVLVLLVTMAEIQLLLPKHVMVVVGVELTEIHLVDLPNLQILEVLVVVLGMVPHMGLQLNIHLLEAEHLLGAIVAEKTLAVCVVEVVEVLVLLGKMLMEVQLVVVLVELVFKLTLTVITGTGVVVVVDQSGKLLHLVLEMVV